jgi:hypothetical protein
VRSLRLRLACAPIKSNVKAQNVARRGYRKSAAGEMVSDAAFIANRLPWWGAGVLGVVSFAVFYWIVPAWLHGYVEGSRSANVRPILEAILGRRIHWFQYLAIALALVCAFFAFRNFLSPFRLSRAGESNAGFFSRILARLLD